MVFPFGTQPDNYQYGYPAAGSAEAGVTPLAQWIFHETAGPIVDQVASLSLAEVVIGAGAGVYGIRNFDHVPFEDIQPGASGYDPSIAIPTGNWIYWFSNTLAGQLDIGTNDFTVEAWVELYDTTTTLVNFVVFDTGGVLGGGPGMQLAISKDQSDFRYGNISFVIIDDIAGTCTSYTGSLKWATLLNQGRPYKIRVKVDRSEPYARIFLNGADQTSEADSTSLSIIAGQTISPAELAVGTGQIGYASRFTGVLHELRICTGLANSGGPGGG